MAINGIVQYTSGFLPDILLFTQAPILVWFDGTIILHGNNNIYVHGRHSAVCVCFLTIYSGRHVRWMYQPGSHRRKVTGFLIHFPSAVHAFIFLAKRIQPFLSLVDRKSNFVY